MVLVTQVPQTTIDSTAGPSFEHSVDPGLFSEHERQAVLHKIAAAAETQALPKYIAVEGPIGVGKTTLTRKLAAAFNYPLMLEPVTENPFLGSFYGDGSNQALPTQLFFLLYRAKQIQNMPGNSLLTEELVTDFMFEKDDLFAQLTLDANELALYQQIQTSLNIRPHAPDLVIYLQAPASVLLQRVQRRGLDFEQSIQFEYLEELAERYTEFFYYYDEAPVLVVNAAEVDFANESEHFSALLDQIFQMEGTRQFFNHNPTLL